MNFLSTVADEIVAKNDINLSNLHIILPTNRACYFFRKALVEKNKLLWLPTISTLSDWVEKMSGLKKIATLDEIFLLHSIYLQSGRAESLDEFLPLGRTLCSDFEELDMHAVRMEKFFRDLRNLASMKVYEPATELTSSQLDYLKFWERFEKLYTELRAQLLAEDKANSGMMFRLVADKIESISEGLNNFYFIGFDGLTKAEETIIKHLHIHNKAQVFWDTDAWYVKDAEREAGYFFRKYFKTWKGNMPYCENNLLIAKKNVEVISVARSVGQAKVAVELITNRLKLTDNNAINTAIILPDEKLLQPLQYLLPSTLSSYNLTMGLPVSRSVSGEFMLLLFKLHESAERLATRAKKHKLYFKDVVALFQHPFLKVFAKENELHQTIEEIRAKNIVFIPKSFFEKKEDLFIENILDSIYHSSDTSVYLSQISRVVNLLIDKFKRVESREIELEFLLKISDAIAAVSKPLLGATIQPKTIRALLSDEFKNYRVSFEGEPAKGLQIMGLMESRCLDFKNVIILSTNEGNIPSGKSTQSYIPHPLRNELLFSHTQRDAKTAYLFYRLFHKAENVFLLYDTEGNRMGGGEKSRFILQLQYELAKQNSKFSIKEMVYSVAPPEIKIAEPIIVEKNEALQQKIKDNVTYGLSPSGLSTYINCSLQYYFRYVAGLKEPEDIEENMESNTMGTAIHHVLEVLYKENIGKEISAEWVETIRKDSALITTLLKEGFSEKFDEEALLYGKNNLQFRLSLEMIYSFLANEKRRIEEGQKIKIEALETPLETTFGVAGMPVKIKGFADRIETQNNVLTIVDFKSGKAKNVILKEEEVAIITNEPALRVQFQLLIYAWTYLRMNPNLKQSIQSGIFWLQKTSDGFDNLTIESNSLLNENILQPFETELKKLLEDLLNPDKPFVQAEDIERCKYCPYKQICKRG